MNKLLPALAPQHNTGFVILDTTPQFEVADLFVYYFFVGNQARQDKAFLIGSLVGRYQDDEAFCEKLLYCQGLMRMRFGKHWFQSVGRLSEKEAKTKSQEQKLQAAITKIKNKYQARKSAILQSPSLFKDQELAELEHELEQALKQTTFNYRHNPKFKR
jgi:hypothetical protein